MARKLVADIDWQSLIWSDVNRPSEKRLQAEKAFSNFPAGKLSFIQHPQVWEINGEEIFYRFANPQTALKHNDVGAWWIDQKAFQDIKELSRHNGGKFVDNYRANFGVSRDWSDLDHLYELRVPFGMKILAVIGETKYQPEYSSKSKVQSNLIFIGRGGQVFFRGEDLQKFHHKLVPDIL